MQNTHGRTRIFGQAALVALLAAPVLGAQSGLRDDSDFHQDRSSRTYDSRDQRSIAERRLFTWRGNVDAGARIYIRGDMVRAMRVDDANDSRGRNRGRTLGRVDLDRALPRRDGTVRVQLLEGRGRVDVVQQPSAANDYTAIVQVRDWRSGKDNYRVAAFFEPSANYRGDRNGNRNGGDRNSGDRNGGDRNGGVWGDSGGDVYSGTTALRWSGNVDGDLRISIWRGQLSYQTASGMQPTNVRANVGNAQTRSAGQLAVQLRMGRGAVQVIEQPSSYNNYTAVVRVLDQQGGYGYYDFDLIWQ
ncbi:MAG TPA: hypothetical protein VKH19_09575 [Gemmatimonadaceae bacterium]|nr:hypothetical protein [Gemmatimonadaceae bacterium]